MVMAYYEGATLAAKMKQGPVAPPDAVSIAMQVVRGLAEAHSRNVVHRDIKPSNIILTTQGVAKILDFGLARVISSASNTQTARLAGTVSYMSPEQALQQALDRRTDLWSLGVVLYEMVTGRRAFRADSTPATLFAIVHNAPPPMDASVRPALRRVIYRALAKDPAARYQSASEMLADLEALDGASPAAAGPTVTMSEVAGYRDLASHSEPLPAHRRYLQFLLAILALVVLVLAGLLVRSRLALPGASERHIAVLPIFSLGGDPASAALAEGIQESLTSRLSNLEVGNQSLWVVPASEVQRRKVSDPAAAQKEFGVNLVITGSVQRDGSLLRLTVNLIDARNLRQVGSGQFQDRTGDFSTLQDSAVAKLANLMKIAVTPEMLRATGGAVQPAAYETYLKARGYLQRPFTGAAFDEAIKLLDSAIHEDPNFSLAFASLGQAYLTKYKNDQDPRWLDLASANCKQALALNDRRRSTLLSAESWRPPASTIWHSSRSSAPCAWSRAMPMRWLPKRRSSRRKGGSRNPRKPCSAPPLCGRIIGSATTDWRCSTFTSGALRMPSSPTSACWRSRPTTPRPTIISEPFTAIWATVPRPPRCSRKPSALRRVRIASTPISAWFGRTRETTPQPCKRSKKRQP
jgi:serine/threonine-protein kinase